VVVEFLDEFHLRVHIHPSWGKKFNPLSPSDAVRKQKKYFRGSFQFSFVTIKKISPPGNHTFNYLGIFQILKLRISIEKILSISLKLNFTPNTLDCWVNPQKMAPVEKAVCGLPHRCKL